MTRREWLTVNLRYKTPGEATSILLEHPFLGSSREISEADADFRFATAVAAASMMLRNSEGMSDMRLEDAASLAKDALGPDPFGHRAEFVRLLELHASHRPLVRQ